MDTPPWPGSGYSLCRRQDFATESRQPPSQCHSIHEAFNIYPHIQHILPRHCTLDYLMACFLSHYLWIQRSKAMTFYITVWKEYNLPTLLHLSLLHPKQLTVPAPLTKRDSISLAAYHKDEARWVRWHQESPWQRASKFRSRASEACSMSNLHQQSEE